MTEKDKDLVFVEYIIKEITGGSDNVVYERKVDDLGVLITVSAPREETAKIIGKKGETANAIRLLTKIVGFNNNSRVNIRINSPEQTTNENK